MGRYNSDVYNVTELRNEGIAAPVSADDWMTALLLRRAFHRVPPRNIQAIFMRMERTEHKAAEVVIRQGEVGEFFYAIAAGRCLVVREAPFRKDGFKLAELGIGDTFGEESLICDSRRNATVIMQTDGWLMRLAKCDFLELLYRPLVRTVSHVDATQIVNAGGKWLDVQSPPHRQAADVVDKIRIPLHELRFRLKDLDARPHYVVCSADIRRSCAAAYILCERGFEAFALRDDDPPNAADVQ